jgi:acetolactate synthase-1/2/3 large subunit
MTTTAAKVLVDTLAAHGIDRAFCVPGESYLAVMDCLHDDPVVELVTCRHEGGAAWMALADAKLTGRTGVVLASRGPGATNASIAAHSAEQGAFPLLLLLGQVSRSRIGRGANQEMDFRKTFADMAKWVEQVDDPDRMGEVLARAIHMAESGTPGPVVVALPTDVLAAPSASKPTGPRRRPRARPGAADMERVAELLTAAQRPVLVVGGRVQGTNARRALRAVSETWGLPVMPTYTHQDVFPNRHPHYAGELGIRPPDTVAATALDADVVLAVGTRLGDKASAGRRLPGPGQSIIHVYPDAAPIGRDFDAALGLVCDADAFLEALAGRNAPEPAAGREAWLRKAHAGYTAFAELPPRDAADGFDFGHVIEAMKHTVPDDAVITVDAGSFASWLHLKYPFTSTQSLLGSECGAMGMSIPAAIAAALRHPERQVVSLVGDGGALMSAYELATAMAMGVKNLCVIVSNNKAYGTIRFHQEKFYPGRPHATDLVNPDFAALARAFGAEGMLIERAQDAQPVLRDALAHAGVVVVEARCSLENVDAKNTIAALRGAR